MPLREAIAEFSGVDYDAHPDARGLARRGARSWPAPRADWTRGKILDELLTVFVEPKLIEPTFLIDYPTAFPGSTLAKGKPDNPDEVERFEAFAGGIEIANAFSELNDPRVQRERFLEQVAPAHEGDDEAQPFDDDFLHGARARHAADRWAGRRHRPPGDAADRPAFDPRRDPLPAAAATTDAQS